MDDPTAKKLADAMFVSGLIILVAVLIAQAFFVHTDSRQSVYLNLAACLVYAFGLLGWSCKVEPTLKAKNRAASMFVTLVLMAICLYDWMYLVITGLQR